MSYELLELGLLRVQNMKYMLKTYADLASNVHELRNISLWRAQVMLGTNEIYSINYVLQCRRSCH